MNEAVASLRSAATRLHRWLAEWIQSRKRPANKRALVHEILSIQVLSAALIGGLAIAGLYWGGQWILQDNYGRWALQWTEELNELAAPLYLVDDGEAQLRIESFVERYPEIRQVTYFGTDGSVLFTVGDTGPEDAVANLPTSRLEEATDLVGAKEPYLLHSDLLSPREFDILGPVWSESMAEDALFEFDADTVDAGGRTKLLGFVGIHLDFVIFHDRLLGNIKAAVLILLALLLLFAWLGRRALRRALSSISDLQAPIQELAKGNLGVKFIPAEHREISEIVEALETTAAALSERDAKLLQMANHDSLTGLFNRRRFVEELRKEIVGVMRHGHSSALLFVDLDQFKYINDACGHPAGDRLLRKVADELLRSVRQGDTVARFGGDEFAVLIRRTSLAGAQSSAQTILANMRRLAHIEGEQVFHTHCSVGIAMIDGEHLHCDEVINKADIACRDAKQAGRNRLAVYDAMGADEDKETTDVGWVNRLRNALDTDGFELHFQPINNIHSGETTHHEVLIRLPGADGNLVAPDAFLTSAMRFGLMSEIDFWMIENAAKAYARYSTPERDLRLSINLSASAFEGDNLVRHIENAFERHGVDPRHIILEITESLAIRHTLHVEKQITALREMGCEFALDDFGTGYSSFSYLQQLHFDYIKIDGTFVEDVMNRPVDQKMIRLIAEVAREAGMKTVAEYVQDAPSLALLEQLGVDLAQGYFVGKPRATPECRSTPISLGFRRLRQTIS